MISYAFILVLIVSLVLILGIENKFRFRAAEVWIKRRRK
jgi:membrane protein CcdC involved in cytochrome C biogenesis